MRWLLIFLPLLAWGKPKQDDLVILNAQHASSGLFAMMTYVIGALELYERRTLSGLTVNFGVGGLYYDPSVGSNWWTYYFEPIHLPAKGKKSGRSMTSTEMNQCMHAVIEIPDERRGELVRKYVKVKPQILRKVDAFIGDQFLGKKVIGVHYRGTDKKTENPRVPFASIYEVIERPEFHDFIIFAATDEAAFLDAISARYPGRVIATKATRSLDERAVHFNSSEPYKIGEEAVIDSVILSHCDFLIRTPSTLSWFSTFLNPKLPKILLEN